ncbi:hypothetical protein SAMN04489729_2391 [Amycolatopsis lurida]|nr:hypothetical protein SAMN04489729_2391 [Amycolatopsis lurida]
MSTQATSGQGGLKASFTACHAAKGAFTASHAMKASFSPRDAAGGRDTR